MRNRTLIKVIVAIVIIAMAMPAFAGSAVSVSGQVVLTEQEAGCAMGTQIEAYRSYPEKTPGSERYKWCGRYLGIWSSVTNFLPKLVHFEMPAQADMPEQKLVYRMTVHFANIQNIERVVLTPDNGITLWEATNVPLKGYTVELPQLLPGGYGLKWEVFSRDRRGRLILFIIPICWSANRESNVVQQIVVQDPDPLLDCKNFRSDADWMAMLSPAFVPATALPDQAFLAQRQSLTQQSTQSQPVVVPTPPPPVQPDPPKQTIAQPDPPPPTHQIEDKPVVNSLNFEGKVSLAITSDSGNTEFPIVFYKPRKISVGDPVEFYRGTKFVASGEVTDISNKPKKVINVWIVEGGRVRPSDDLCMEEK